MVLAGGVSASTVIYDKTGTDPSLTVGDQCWGSSGASFVKHQAQHWLSVSTFSSIEIKMDFALRGVTASDSFFLELWSDDGTDFPLALLATSAETYPFSDLSDRGVAWVEKTFTITFAGSDATDYHILTSRTDFSGTTDADKGYCVSNTGADVYFPFKTFPIDGDFTSSSFSIFDLIASITQDATPPITPNEITTPLDLATVTTRPFNVSGTCDAGSNISPTVIITHKNSGAFMESVQVQCIADAWSAGGMGNTLWNDDYFITLLPDDLGLALDFIEITLDVTDNPVPAPPTVAEDIGCDTGQVIPDALCNVLTWLFIPNNDAIQQFADLFDKVKLKPPIGYVTAGFVLWDSFAIGTSPDTLDGTNDLSAYFDPMKAVITALLWVLFLVWIIRRVGTMNI